MSDDYDDEDDAPAPPRAASKPQPKYTYQVEGEDNERLTYEGKAALQRWWHENTLADATATISLDEISDAEFFRTNPKERETWLWSVELAEIRAALVEAKAKLDPNSEEQQHFLARWNDGLGAECGKFGQRPPRPASYLAEKLIPEAGVTAFVGDSDSLKSFLAVSLAVSIAHKGRPWLGRHAIFSPGTSEDARVVYVDYEMGSDELERRLRLLGDDGSVIRVCHPNVQLDDDQFWAGLKKLNPRFVVLDSLSSGFQGIDEKDARFANPLRRATAFAEKHHCTFVFIHHSPKDVSGGNFSRGTAAIKASTDAFYYLERVGEERVRVKCIKMRRDKKPAPFEFEMTDKRGVTACDPKPPPKSMTTDERVLGAFRETPGISTEDVGKTLTLGVPTVRAARARLEKDGRLRKEGNANRPRYVAVDDPVSARPDDPNGSGNGSGNEKRA